MRRGLSLVELLVVIAIIIVLSAIAASHWMAVLSASRANDAMSRLRGIGIAMTLYTEDFNGWGPTWSDHWLHVTWGVLPAPEDTPAGRWDAKLVPYVGAGNAPLSEAELDRSGAWHSPLSELGPGRRSIGMNQLLSMRFLEKPEGGLDLSQRYWRAWPLAIADRPSATVLLGESGEDGLLGPPTNFDAWRDRHIDRRIGFRREAPFRARSRPSYLMADLSARKISQAAIYPMPDGPGRLNPWFGPAHCAAAQFFAPSPEEQELHRRAAKQEWGTDCPE